MIEASATKTTAGPTQAGESAITKPCSDIQHWTITVVPLHLSLELENKKMLQDKIGALAIIMDAIVYKMPVGRLWQQLQHDTDRIWEKLRPWLEPYKSK